MSIEKKPTMKADPQLSSVEGSFYADGDDANTGGEPANLNSGGDNMTGDVGMKAEDGNE